MNEEQITNDNGFLAKNVTVTNQLGIHARPATKLVEVASKYESDVSLTLNDQTVDGKSILDILTLAAGFGDTLEIKAKGDDAEKVLEDLDKLFQERFGEKK